MYYHEYDDKIEFIDSEGQLWSFKYDFINKINLPGKIKTKLTTDQVRKIICDYSKDTEIEKEIILQLNNATSIESLIEIIVDRI